MPRIRTVVLPPRYPGAALPAPAPVVFHLRAWLRRWWPQALILGVGLPAFWVALWLTIGPPFEEPNTHPGAHWPGWHVDAPGR